MIKSISRSSFPFEFVTTGTRGVLKINTSVLSKDSVVDIIAVVEAVVALTSAVVVVVDGVIVGHT